MNSDKIGGRQKEEAVKKLIRETVASAVDITPDEIPHRVKARLKGQACGDLDVDAYVRELMSERKR